jgi:hypothetical protein
MKMNENLLLSWHPRHPSAGLRRRILQLAGEDEGLNARWLWSCVAPTMACALLTFMALDHDRAGLAANVPMALILSSQDNAAFATGGAQTGQNHLAAVSFDTTNRLPSGILTNLTY